MFEAPTVQKNVSYPDVSVKLFVQISIKSKQSDAIGKGGLDKNHSEKSLCKPIITINVS